MALAKSGVCGDREGIWELNAPIGRDIPYSRTPGSGQDFGDSTAKSALSCEKQADVEELRPFVINNVLRPSVTKADLSNPRIAQVCE